MIEKIYEYSGKLYKSLISIFLLNNENIFPLEINKLRLRLNETEWMLFFQTTAKELEQYSKKNKSFGYSVKYQSSGKSKIVHEIRFIFETLDDYLKFINKENDYIIKLNNFNLLIKNYSNEKDLIAKNINLLSLKSSDLMLLIEYTNFLKENPNYIYNHREIPLNASTKFIEQNKRNFKILWKILKIKLPLPFNTFTPLIRFRLSETNQTFIYNKNIVDYSILLNDFIEIKFPEKYIFIIENKTTYLHFPAIKDSVIIHGEGYFYRKLIHAKFLNDKLIYYYGDLDIDGLNILSGVRRLFPGTKSILMNKEIFLKYNEFTLPNKKKIHNLPSSLTDTEKELFIYLNSIERNRLEQEKIPISEVENWILSIKFSTPNFNG